tara:strand:+ start:42 stop:248 length:207 start_codon:yes stop_codon:yes gene_type:complete
MTNSTPSLIAWPTEYQKYLGLLGENADEEAVLLKKEIEEGLEWIGLNWEDLEFANEHAGAVHTESTEL